MDPLANKLSTLQAASYTSALLYYKITRCKPTYIGGIG